MEEEQIFLFVAYYLEENDCVYNDRTRTEERSYLFTLKRASMQKYARDGEKFTRVPIEFDPLNNQQCYVVVMYVSEKEKGMILKNQPRFPLITLSIMEAEEEVKKINNNTKQYCKNDELFEDVVILPTIITLT